MNALRFPRVPFGEVRATWPLICAVSLATLTGLSTKSAFAQLLDLGELPAGSSTVTARDISGDGRVVVGHLYSGPTLKPFRWTLDQGMQPLGTFDYATASGVSGDGRYITGVAHFVAGVNVSRAYRWSAADGFTDLGTLSGDISSWSMGISRDGAVVVGYSVTPSYDMRAFRWTAAGMQDLGSLQNGSTYANGVSGDGNVVVGSSYVAGQSHAYRWDAVNGMVDIHPTDSVYSNATAANRNGSVVVGSHRLGSRVEAFRWSAPTGIQNLGSLGGIASFANDVSADGSVVVGASEIASREHHAYRWSAATGMVDLGVLAGQTRSEAMAVSDDGATIVGNSGNRAFIWNVAMQDLANLQASVVRSADTINQLISSENRRLRDLNQPHCLPNAMQRFCLGLDASGYGGEADGTGTQRASQLAGGLRINENVAVGATASVGRADLREHSAEQRNAWAVAMWADYRAHSDNSGWGASASVAAGNSDNRYNRGLDLNDVQRAQARLDMNSTALRLAAQYGIQLGNSRVTPELAVSHVRTQQSGFVERNVVFPLTVHNSNSRETYATLGVRSATPVSANGTLHLSLAVDTLLNEDTPAIQGRSRIPGLETFTLHSSLNKRPLVPVAGVGYGYAVNANSSIAAQVQAGTSVYEAQGPIYGMGVQYRYAF